MTLDDLESDEVFSAAVRGLPKIVKLIAAIPEEKRSLALRAAQQSYLRTAQAVGYDESDAPQWASALVSLLEIAATTSELATAKKAEINKTKHISNSLREGQIPTPSFSAPPIKSQSIVPHLC
jgi:Glu-tRNA(Gln) amidotransferase subunit E-like FAD-binding protein